ncbi:MAG: hypothetical protein FD127_1628 [Acidimicrobiaceae bacterium]|nr:MAG: hypothetical protein FD127_1628 [Acidimicrobiaceae bacterium]
MEVHHPPMRAPRQHRGGQPVDGIGADDQGDPDRFGVDDQPFEQIELDCAVERFELMTQRGEPVDHQHSALFAGARPAGASTSEPIEQPPQALAVVESHHRRTSWVFDQGIPPWVAQPVDDEHLRTSRPGEHRAYQGEQRRGHPAAL